MSASADTLLAELGALVGGRARAAGPEDAVAGVTPRVVAEPGGEEEVAAVLAYADRAGLAILPRGGGTQPGLGFPPARGDIILSTTRLDGIIEHVPHDQTVSVRAGMRLADLQAALGAAGQWLALDPLLAPGATVGGLIATNASGARRLRFGGVRDQIIGVRVALADGTLAKGGGKVVKNVAGYDLPKLFTGSLGSLGVIVAATFRLYPLPTASRTVTLGAADPAPLCDVVLRALGSTLAPTILDVLGPVAPGDGFLLAARFESGVAAAVIEQAAEVAALAGEFGGRATTLAGEAEAAFWREADGGLALNREGEASALLKASVLPAGVAPWLGRLRDETSARGLAVRCRAHAGHGIVYARLAGAEDALAGAIAALREAALAGRGSLVAQDAPPALARRIDVWGPTPALALMRRVKEAFDPRGTLNPGRFIGGL